VETLAMSADDFAAVVTGPYLAACALLALAGGAKLVRPARTREAARALRLPHSDGAVRALGTIELTIAGAGAVVGGWAAVTVAGCFALLTVAALVLWRRAPDTPCGCLGESRAPAAGGHVVLNAGAAVTAIAATMGASPWTVVADQPMAAIPFLALVACAIWLAALALDALPLLRAAIREGSS
jgi:hypothetical protein